MSDVSSISGYHVYQYCNKEVWVRVSEKGEEFKEDVPKDLPDDFGGYSIQTQDEFCPWWIEEKSMPAVRTVETEREIEKHFEALKDEKEEVRKEAIGALGKLFASDIPIKQKVRIIAFLEASRPIILEMYGVEMELRLFDSLYAFLNQQSEGLNQLIGLVEDQNEDVRYGVLEIFRRIAQRGEPFSSVPLAFKTKMAALLIKTLKDGNKWVRKTAAWALGELAKDEEMSPTIKTEMAIPLIEALEDKDDDVKWQVARSLGWLTEEDISSDLRLKMVEPLKKASGSKNKNVRFETLNTLGVLSFADISLGLKEKIADLLMKALKNRQEWQPIRSLAYQYLERHVAAGTFPPLRSKEIQKVLAMAEKDLGRATIEREVAIRLEALKSSLPLARRNQATALRELTKSNIPLDLKAKMVGSLIEALSDEEANVRLEVAWALGNLAELNISTKLKAKMVAPLIKALGDEDGRVRQNAARSLGILAGLNIPPELKAEMANPLVKALSDEGKSVRKNVAAALTALARSDISPELKAGMVYPLAKALNDEDQGVQKNAAAALAILAYSDIPAQLRGYIRLKLGKYEYKEYEWRKKE